MKCCSPSIKQEVSLPYPLYQSEKGNYFIGQTPLLTGLVHERALVTLKNPCNSHVNIYLNAITVTNISSSPVSAEIYLHTPFVNSKKSHLVSCTNTAITPTPKGEIHYVTTTSQPPTSGIPIFSRIVPSLTTLVIDGSQIIIAPHQVLTIYLGGYLPLKTDSAIVALGWWEEEGLFS
ncbi:hypothetical protein CS063_03565 [Sporanaerobium hydrogeniformans]|uniref:Uncharacterized protein n=1 Tax=Sporanaerobium hydrogeniformans TaxID=3072179 RepID=A0AC61DEC7_9FIRM|nr:DUF6143 family protein [Sporanaerobium hydrogeniformans]PHV71654.1 hypothetical protein CS063_03565 [Sporanaerobium hydrogeniformans]